MKFDLIALDLDGTALRSDRSTFSPRLEAVLLGVHRRGTAVVPVTGRQYGMLPPAVLGNTGWENLAVLCNGGEVRRLDGGALLEAHYLTGGELLPLVEAAAALGLPVELSSGGTLYLTRSDWELERGLGTLPFHVDAILSRWGRPVDDLAAFCRDFPGTFEKVNLPYIPDELRTAAEKLLSSFPFSAVWSSARGMEVTHREATKEAGLRSVCGLLSVDPARTIAIGDSGNDVSMLRAAGLGVAMGNAPDWVKAEADAVTGSNEEDGAATALARYVLEEII